MPRGFESSGFPATSFQKGKGCALREGFPRTAYNQAFASRTARNPSPPVVGPQANRSSAFSCAGPSSKTT